jgi:FAD/FMN-containing dehydrogenase
MCAGRLRSKLPAHRFKELADMLTTDHATSSSIDDLLVRPGDPDWDVARQSFNLLVDQQPVAVAFPTDEREVAAVVAHARAARVRVAPQATGHNAGPLGSLSGTLLLNTSKLTGVEIDAAARIVRAGAGAKWQDVVPQLSQLGLAALHGSAPDVGIVGYSLGGGLGWLGRRYGLQCNSVTAIELVTADGDLIRTDHIHEPDLFWALRGGGGNFGVVTAIEFQVYPVEELYAGAMFFPFERATEVFRTWNELRPELPDELTSWATVVHFPDLPFLPDPVRGASFAIIFAAFLGDERDGADLLSPIRALGPVMDTLAMVPPAALADLAMEPPEPMPYLSTHNTVGEVPGNSLEDVLAVVGPESGIIAFQLRDMGGALTVAPDGAGARGTLEGDVSMFAVGLAGDEQSAQRLERSLERVHAALVDHQVGEYASFVEVPSDASAFYDEATWARLRAVKGLYDAEDLIRANHHIPPSR